MGIIKQLFSRRRVTDDSPTASLERAPAPVLRVGNVQGIGLRERQEDSFAVLNTRDAEAMAREGLFAVLADGMGGMEDGRGASELAVGAMRELFPALFRAEDPAQLLEQAVRDTSDQVFRTFSGRSGTTLMALWIKDGAARWVSVGDSAMYLMRSGGLFQLNREHTFLNRLYLWELDAPRIDKARAQDHEDAHRLTSFVGIDRLEEVDLSRRPLPLHPGDTFLLCSDGISGVLTPPEIMEALRLPPDEGCALLEKLVREKEIAGQDNYTGIIINYQET